MPAIWKKTPLLRPLVCFAAGICLQACCSLSPSWLFLPAGLCMLSLIFYHRLPLCRRYACGWAAGCALSLLFILAGAGFYFSSDIRHHPHWAGRIYQDHFPVLLRIYNTPQVRGGSWKCSADVTAVYTSGHWQTTIAKTWLHLPYDPSAPMLTCGSQLVTNASLKQVPAPGNPGAFDYPGYSASQNIFFQCAPHSGQYRLLAGTSRSFGRSLSLCRTFLLSLLRLHLHAEAAAGVAEALLFGYRNDLDPALAQAYSNTGAIHVIVLAGLHLGMIYGLLVLLFRPLAHKRWCRWLRPLVILAALWAFCLIAGAGASTLRSTVMLSCMILGQLINRKIPVYNNLAASAFVLLIIQPHNLMDPGFQLSYAAVTGIILFSTPIKKWIPVHNKLLGACWEMCAVGLSAQILTFPLMLYRFHQLPLLFLVANLFAVPLSGLILYLELALIPLSHVPFAGPILGKTVSLLIHGMDGFIVFLNRLPFCSIRAVFISGWQTACLYIALIAVITWLARNKKAGLWIAFAALLIFCCFRDVTGWQQEHRKRLVVYQFPHHTAIDLVSGHACLFLHNGPVGRDTLLSHIGPSRICLGIVPAVHAPGIAWRYPLIITAHKKVLVLDRVPAAGNGRRIRVDAIILTHALRATIAELYSLFDCQLYIFDNTNSLWKINGWRKEAEQLHLRHYSVPEQGAFLMDL